MNSNLENESILLFDGVCNLCNTVVQFVIKRDSKAHFKFASLQSDLGQRLLKKHKLNPDSIDTVVLVEKNKAYIKSTAVLRLVRKFSGAWPLLFIFIIIPTALRDWAYDWVAGNRYKWYGKMDSCMMPDPGLKHRFLD